MTDKTGASSNWIITENYYQKDKILQSAVALLLSYFIKSNSKSKWMVICNL